MVFDITNYFLSIGINPFLSYRRIVRNMYNNKVIDWEKIPLYVKGFKNPYKKYNLKTEFLEMIEVCFRVYELFGFVGPDTSILILKFIHDVAFLPYNIDEYGNVNSIDIWDENNDKYRFINFEYLLCALNESHKYKWFNTFNKTNSIKKSSYTKSYRKYKNQLKPLLTKRTEYLKNKLINSISTSSILANSVSASTILTSSM